MPTIPCSKRIACVSNPLDPTGEFDWPFLNTSSEAPDGQVFVSVLRKDPNVEDNIPRPDPNPPGPKVGYQWTSQGCKTLCVSYVSAEEAALCAAAQSLICDSTPEGDQGGTGEPGGPTSPDSPSPGDGQPNCPCGGSTGGGNGGPTGAEWFGNDQQIGTAHCPDGTPFYYVQDAMSFTAQTKSEANAIALSYANKQAQDTMFCIGDITADACLNVAYSSTIFPLLPVDPPYMFSMVLGVLPPGINLVQGSDAGILTGTPTSIGSYDFSILCSNGLGRFIVKDFTIRVMGLPVTTLNSGTVGAAYFDTLAAAGGTSPYTYTVKTGFSMPPGLTLIPATGVVIGTPTLAGISGIPIVVTDSNGKTCEQTVTITITGVAGTTFRICNWDKITADTAFAAAWAGLTCDASLTPEWDGLFNLSETDPISGKKFYYFINKAILAVEASADGCADYPAGPNWKHDRQFTGLYFEGGLWRLLIKCLGDAGFAWEGTLVSADPTNPSGEYTRVSGAIMAETVQVRDGTGPPCSLLAWYKFESLTGPFPGDSEGLPTSSNRTLVGSIGGGGAAINTVAGKVGNAVEFIGAGGDDASQVVNNKPELVFHDQITFTGWINVNEAVATANNSVVLSYTWSLLGGGSDQVGFKFYHPGLDPMVTAWNIYQFAGVDVDIPFAIGWHFFVFTFDRLTGELTIEIDRGGATHLAGAARAASDITAGAFFELMADPDGLGALIAHYDEVAVWDGLLTSAQLDWLYNSGTGRTYPPASPPF